MCPAYAAMKPSLMTTMGGDEEDSNNEPDNDGNNEDGDNKNGNEAIPTMTMTSSPPPLVYTYIRSDSVYEDYITI